MPLQAIPDAADWPLVGRTEELAALRRMRTGSGPDGVVIRGAAGVGKSRLARLALEEAAAQGWATLVLRAAPGLRVLPLAPLRAALRLPDSADLAALTGAAMAEVEALRGPRGLVVLAEDAHELDDASAALLHQLVASGALALIVTARGDAACPAAVTSLWKDGLAERVELAALSRDETLELVTVALGGPVEDSSANRLWHVTAGNPLYVREVLASSLAAGSLVPVEGEWRWREDGEWAAAGRLREIVAAGLGRLDPDELSAMEMLAVAGPLPLAVLARLTAPTAIEALERRSLVVVERTGRRLEIAIDLPLHAEVLRAGMSTLQRRSVGHNLAEALASTGARRAADRVRLAIWSVEAGYDVDPVTLARGTDASLFAVGQTVSARLRDVMPDLAVDLPTGPPLREDVDVALRLAWTTYDRTGSVADGLALVSTLAWTGATSEAEAVLAEVADRAEQVDDRLRLALALGWVRFWCRADPETAAAGLRHAVDTAPEGSDPRLVADLLQELAGIRLNTADPAGALAHAESAAAVQGVELARSVAAPPAAAALAYLGRCADAVALVEAALPEAYASGHPLTVATLLYARAGALARQGQLEEARRLAEWLRDVALADGQLDATGIFGVLLGEILLRQGLPASAARILRDSSGLLAERDLLGYRPWALSGLARARAVMGHEENAGAALAEARRIQPIGRMFDISHHLAEMEIHLRAGRTGEAVNAARAGADWARAAGMVVDEALALDAWVRIEPGRDLAQRLAELAGRTDSDLVAAVAAQARALAAGDAAGLLGAARQLAGLTAWRLAAEAAGAAAALLSRRGEARAAGAARRDAATYFSRCEGPPPAVLGALVSPVPLTRREREVAHLASTGLSSRDIAERMYLSHRTVENHLHRAYVKLGVTDRAGLASALSGSPPS